MCGTAGSEEAPVALEIKVVLGWMGHFAINNSACRAVSTTVGILLLLGEEPDMMSFANHNNSYSGADFQFSTGISQCWKFCKRDITQSKTLEEIVLTKI